MGFGVKYTGPDGKKRSFEMDSVPRKGSELADIASGRGRFPDFRRSAEQDRRPAVAKTEADVMPGGGVVKGRNGMLCLMGEESSPLIEGVRLFASVNGRKGYHTLDEIDMPSGGGARVGPAGECDQEDPVADHRQKSDGAGWATSVTGRLFAKREGGHTVVYQYTKDLLVSPGQRLVGVTEERRRVVCLIPEGDGGDWPFKTKWVGTDEDGGWAMYLPDGCLMVDDRNVSVSEGMAEVEGQTGWFELDAGSGPVSVRITWPEEGGADDVVAEIFYGEASSGSEDGNVSEYKLCEIYDDYVEQIQASRLFVSSDVKCDELSLSKVKDENGEPVEPTKLGLLDFQDDGWWRTSGHKFSDLLLSEKLDGDSTSTSQNLKNDTDILIRRRQQVGDVEKYVLEYIPIGDVHRIRLELDDEKNKSLGLRWDPDKEAWILWCEGGGGGGDDDPPSAGVKCVTGIEVVGGETDVANARLKITYSDGEEKFIQITSAEDSNVKAKAVDGNLELGVYYT